MKLKTDLIVPVFTPDGHRYSSGDRYGYEEQAHCGGHYGHPDCQVWAWLRAGCRWGPGRR